MQKTTVIRKSHLSVFSSVISDISAAFILGFITIKSPIALIENIVVVIITIRFAVYLEDLLEIYD
ncbi:hypothetical protein A3H80_01325 [Candidatus Roizmanbacteria bacterium RIFCSPLOWO2_02_FULL_37_19]|nr:MAG: hypothetical protein A3H80_01325 [Candidatus Roizmanbacteria bacterium RIFCSPLOWO2_02_FULL_37_19]